MSKGEEFYMVLHRDGNLKVDYIRGTVTRTYRGRQHTYCGKEKGYITFGSKQAGRHNRAVAHRIIWMCAYGEIPKNCCIHHKNGIKTDNRLENLEMVDIKKHNREIHNGMSNRLEVLLKGISIRLSRIEEHLGIGEPT